MSVFEKLTQFLETEEIGCDVNAEEETVRFNFTGDAGSWIVISGCMSEAHRLIFLSVLPTLVPEDRRTEVGEFINRVNFAVLVGNFEMDLDSGEVRFRTSIDYDDVVVTPEMIRNLFYANVYMTNLYFSALHKVAFGETKPIDAIDLVEAGFANEA